MADQKGRDPRVTKLERHKREIRGRYSRVPFLDWFKRDPVPPKDSNVRLEKGDALAMIIAVLSLVLPWVLGLGGAIALVIWLIGRILGW